MFQTVLKLVRLRYFIQSVSYQMTTYIHLMALYTLYVYTIV